jgi:hypothetical protein
MEFIIHLGIIVIGIVWLVWLFNDPGWCVFGTGALVCGYLGSDSGFLGTVIGLVVGGLGGGILAAIGYGIAGAVRRKPPTPAPVPALLRDRRGSDS